MKNIMILCLMAPLVAFAQYESRSITVYGTAQQEIKPDEIWIDVHFEEHTKLKNSMMDDQVKEFQLILSKWDISQDNVEMTDFTSSRYSTNTNGRVSLSKEYRLKLTNYRIVNQLLIDIVATGAQRVFISDLKYNDLENMKLEVTKEAIENARNKAAMMVEAQGDQLGKTLSIKEYGAEDSEYSSYRYESTFTYRSRMNATGAVSRSMPAQEEFNVKEVIINSKVKVTYMLQ
ncbi:MAG: hypothetical protein CMP48_06070 [Rickettsiales bacterium]|nr:hypothetical protein [Rickettsiales bacterium]